MIRESDKINSDDIGGAIASGSRVSIHKLTPDASRNPSILRVPIDDQADENEVSNVRLLYAYFQEFLPNPQIITAEIKGKVRKLIQCDYIETDESRNFQTEQSFSKNLDTLPTIEEKIEFLRNLRLFIDRCKKCFSETQFLPDLVGRGNFISMGTSVFLLDSNNMAFEPYEGLDKIIIPLDNRGIPVFDMSLRLLYRIEKGLLTYDETNLSTQNFNRDYRRARVFRGNGLPEELNGILTSKQDLRSDRFYGAVRFKRRREAADSLTKELVGLKHF